MVGKKARKEANSFTTDKIWWVYRISDENVHGETKVLYHAQFGINRLVGVDHFVPELWNIVSIILSFKLLILQIVVNHWRIKKTSVRPASSPRLHSSNLIIRKRYCWFCFNFQIHFVRKSPMYEGFFISIKIVSLFRSHEIEVLVKVAVLRTRQWYSVPYRV